MINNYICKYKDGTKLVVISYWWPIRRRGKNDSEIIDLVAIDVGICLIIVVEDGKITRKKKKKKINHQLKINYKLQVHCSKLYLNKIYYK